MLKPRWDEVLALRGRSGVAGPWGRVRLAEGDRHNLLRNRRERKGGKCEHRGETLKQKERYRSTSRRPQLFWENVVSGEREARVGWRMKKNEEGGEKIW